MAWWFIAACAVAAALTQGLAVPRLPRRLAADGDLPPRYDLMGRPLDIAAATSLAAAGAVLVALTSQNRWPLLVWWAYLAGGACLVWIDLRTTWLPRRLNTLVAMGMGLGAVVAAVGDPWLPAWSLAGAAVAYLVFLGVWRLTGAMGFGDVRLAALVGAVGASGGVQSWGAGLLCGTALGALWGVGHALLVRRRGGDSHFAYGPALWLGPVLASALSGWSP